MISLIIRLLDASSRVASKACNDVVGAKPADIAGGCPANMLTWRIALHATLTLDFALTFLFGSVPSRLPYPPYRRRIWMPKNFLSCSLTSVCPYGMDVCDACTHNDFTSPWMVLTAIQCLCFIHVDSHLVHVFHPRHTCSELCAVALVPCFVPSAAVTYQRSAWGSGVHSQPREAADGMLTYSYLLCCCYIRRICH